MRKVIVPLGLFVLIGALSACGSSGVGDPCALAQPPYEPGQPSCGGEAGSCFQGSEIYIETRSLQCRTRVCMIWHWDQNSLPTEKAEREFCTCKCGGPGDPSTFCSCPSPSFQCVTAFETGEPGIQGAYCVRSELIPDAGMPAADGGM